MNVLPETPEKLYAFIMSIRDSLHPRIRVDPTVHVKDHSEVVASKDKINVTKIVVERASLKDQDALNRASSSLGNVKENMTLKVICGP